MKITDSSGDLDRLRVKPFPVFMSGTDILCTGQIPDTLFFTDDNLYIRACA
jgi:hypothetical protein